MTPPYAGANQRVPEFSTWACFVLGLGAKSYVELGCGSAHFLKQAGIPRVVTVDLLPNGLGGVDHIQADSHDPATVEKVLKHLGGYPDVVFIDADHSTEGARADWQLWWDETRMAVGFHDVKMPTVALFWDEISKRYPSVEIVGRDIASAEAWQHVPHNDGLLNCGAIGILFK